MKKSLKFFVIFLIFVCCFNKKEFGRRIKIEKILSVRNLKQYPTNYLNSIIFVRGKVVEESSKGLWLTIDDNGYIISVNFENSKFSIPSIISNRVLIGGRFISSSEGYIIKGIYLKIEG